MLRGTLLFLIGFICVLVVMGVHVRWRVCPTYAIMEKCHETF